MARPGTIAAAALLSACLAPCAAQAQAASGFNLSGVPLLSPQLPRPAPLMPEPGGAITAQTVTMPVPPLARTTLPALGGSAEENAGLESGAAKDDGVSHAALDDRALERVR